MKSDEKHLLEQKDKKIVCNILYLARCYQQGVLKVQADTFFPAIADKVIIQGPQWAPPLGGSGLGSSCD